MEKKTFYITTPIYYPSDKLHIGHSYCTVATDAIARYKRLQGYDVMFLTGTDEHGQKIETKAKEAGMTPQEFVDHIVEGERGILDLWKLMNISNDRFIRTTDDYHCAAVQKIFKTMYEKGDIYKGTYKGKYCTPCESFWTESQLVDGKCPDCGREVKDAEEEAYFFRLSKYADRIQHLLEDTDFLQPRTRVNEMVNNFIKPGLEDLCVSRTSFTWGIPVDFDPGHVVYVWVDALFNYCTALGFMNEKYDDYDKYWPADVHFVGKEIVRFHSIIWPAMLMSMGMPLPKHVYGHGWLVMDGGKMSKSKGNVVDPYVLAERFGVDALRFFLLRTFPFGSDGNFSNELLINTINVDLANDLGNLVSRTTAMVGKYFGGKLPADRTETAFDADLKAMAAATVPKVEEKMDNMLFSDALIEIWNLIRRTNKYIDETQPWVLCKDEAKKAELANALYNVAESIRIISILIQPFMPLTPAKIWAQLNITEGALTNWESTKTWGLLPAELTVTKGETLFPRIDMKKELESLEAAIKAAQATSLANQAKKEEPKKEAPEEEYPAEITIDDFCKVQLKVGEVIESKEVPKSKKLLRNVVKFGEEERVIFSGIKDTYAPGELVGKRVVVAYNLKPRKMMGEMSYGMILCAEDKDGKLSILTTDDKDFESGSSIS